MTTDSDLVLTPPAAVPKVPVARAAGLVPLDAAQKTELQKRVEGFIQELIAHAERR